MSESSTSGQNGLTKRPFWRIAALALAVATLVTTAATSLALVDSGAAGAAAPHPRTAPHPQTAPHPRTAPHPSTPVAPKLGAAPKIAASVTATVVVDTESDTNPGDPTTACASGNNHTCSLRAAVAVANASSGVDAITVPSGYTITLSLGVLTLTHSMVINGTGATVNGSAAQIIDVDGLSAGVQITGLTLTNGESEEGGAIDLDVGSLVLTDATITHSEALYGGAVYANEGSLWVDGSSFTDNTASSKGGAMYLYEGAAQIVDTTIGGTSLAQANVSPNGAGIFNDAETVVIIDSTISYNSSGAATYGSGVGIYNDETMDISGSAIDHNVSLFGGEGAGIENDEVLTASNTTIDDNSISGVGQDDYGAGYYDDCDTSNFTNVTVDGSQDIGGVEVEGGAVYSDCYQFTWTGGSIADTTTSLSLSSGYVYGGAFYTDSDSATLNDVDISNTTSTSYVVEGGALYNDDYTSLTDVPISGTVAHGSSTAGGYVYGGAIYNEDYLTMTGVPVTGTTAEADLSTASTPSTTSSYIYGGAMYTAGEFDADGLSITGTTVKATGGDGVVYGGGIYNYDDEYSTLTDSQVVGTSVTADDFIMGGLLLNTHALTARNLTLGNGTIALTGGPDVGDGYIDGSILYTDHNLSLVNGTIDNVTSTVRDSTDPVLTGVEIASNATIAQFTNTTIANDSVSGGAGVTHLVSVDGGTSLSLLNTIVASSSPSLNCAVGIDAALLSLGHNLENGTSCGFTKPGDLQSTNPQVAALADNGGSVETGALVAGSPAIDAGTNSGCPPTDARGVARPQGTSCDIGAYEYVPPPTQGYRLVASDGGLFAYGAAGFFGSMGGQHLNEPIVGVAATPDGKGYWEVASDGGIFSFGDAHFYGSMGGQHLNEPIVGIATTSDGKGYWEVASDGGIFSFGDAAFHGSAGSIPLNKPIVGIAASPDGKGYWEVASDGGIFAFGDAHFYGSMGGQHLNEPIVGIAAAPDGKGYWEVASDGGIFSFGSATYYGSQGGQHLNKPIVGIAATPDGKGYWEVGSDGGIFTFGDASYLGSTGAITLNQPVVGIAAS